MPPGQYYHLGLEFNLQKILSTCSTAISYAIDTINLHISIDGLPLFKSSSGEFWPILASISNVPSLRSKVFPIGIYYGSGKPGNCTIFLKEFIDESVALASRGFSSVGRLWGVKIQAFICDAPAKAFILGVKYPQGYSSCTKCTIHGEHNTKVIFTSVNNPLRTHRAFLCQDDDGYHTGNTPLIQLPALKFPHSFPLDYLHVVCLGVVRTMMKTWLGPAHPCKLPASVVSHISSMLLNMQSCIPVEFNRKPRSLGDLNRWKATEYRQFLLYTGPVILKVAFKHLSNYKQMYDHFMTLSVAIYLLVSPKFSSSPRFTTYASNLLIKFINETKNLYGPLILTHNFHSLIHLSADVTNFGSLDNFSSFKYENFLQFFKKHIRKADKPLSQIVNRLGEIGATKNWTLMSSKTHPESAQYLKPHSDGPITSTCDPNKQFKSVQFSAFKISSTPPNCYCSLKNGSIVKVVNISFSNTSMVILCNKFSMQEYFYGHPFTISSEYDIYAVSSLSRELLIFSVTEIENKIILLPYKDKFIAYPLLHSQSD
ncbi:hypothetical protein WDU94_013978 [Cyamophila willieti]